MNLPDSDEIRERIRARLAELDPDGGGAGSDGDVVTLDQQRIGRLTRMDALQARAMAGAVDARRARERRRLRQALARLDAGSWGLCVACDDAIAPARLEIDPAAERCIVCAAAAAE